MDDLPEQDKHQYIGDGVYISFDGFHVWLETQEGNRVALEPTVYQSMRRWIKSYSRLAEHMGETNG